MMYSVHLSSTGRGEMFKDKYIDVLINRKPRDFKRVNDTYEQRRLCKTCGIILKMNADAGKLPSFSLERMECSPLHKVLGYETHEMSVYTRILAQ